jgi:hypothetical protein
MPAMVDWITEIQPHEAQYGTFDRPSARVKTLAPPAATCLQEQANFL